MTALKPSPLAVESDLAEGWAGATLGEIAELVSGAGFPLEFQGKQNLKYPFFKVGNLGEVDSSAHLTTAPDSVDDPVATTLRAKIIPAGSIVFAKIGMAIRLNRRRITGVPCCIDNNMMAAIPNGAAVPRYLQRYLETVDFMELTQATTVPSIRKTQLQELLVPLPPIAEQKRIAKRVEQLLAHVNAARERLARVPDILRRFRQAVLAAACSGRLTADWQATRRSDGDEWERTTLTEIGETRLGKMLDKAKNVGSPTPYLRNLNVRWFSFDISELARMRATQEDRTELNIRDGDLLVCEGGEPGRCAVWNLGPTGIIFQKAIHRIRLANRVIPQWVALNLKNDANSGALQDYFTGSTIKHLTGRSLESYVFPIPPVEEQHEIVRRAEALLNLADTTEKRLAGATARAEKLTQAILAKAFRGELVPTEAELARRAGRPYEPASLLLERIRAERERSAQKDEGKRTRLRPAVEAKRYR